MLSRTMDKVCVWGVIRVWNKFPFWHPGSEPSSVCTAYITMTEFLGLAKMNFTKR